MASFNKVIIMGNLTRDPELKYIPSGSAVGRLGLAMNRKYKGTDGEMKEDVCFVTVVVWGKQAETCNEYLSKGSSVLVEGRLQSSSYETKEGQKRNVLDVVADRVQFLGSKKKVGSDEESVPEETTGSSSGAGEGEDKPPF